MANERPTTPPPFYPAKACARLATPSHHHIFTKSKSLSSFPKIGGSTSFLLCNVAEPFSHLFLSFHSSGSLGFRASFPAERKQVSSSELGDEGGKCDKYLACRIVAFIYISCTCACIYSNYAQPRDGSGSGYLDLVNSHVFAFISFQSHNQSPSRVITIHEPPKTIIPKIPLKLPLRQVAIPIHTVVPFDAWGREVDAAVDGAEVVEEEVVHWLQGRDGTEVVVLLGEGRGEGVPG